MYNSDFEMLQEHDQVAEVEKLSDSKNTDSKNFCDDCGNEIRAIYPISKLELPCMSANVGESAIFCEDCYEMYEYIRQFRVIRKNL